MHAQADKRGRVTVRIRAQTTSAAPAIDQEAPGHLRLATPAPQSTHKGTKPTYPADRSQTLQRAAIARVSPRPRGLVMVTGSTELTRETA